MIHKWYVLKRIEQGSETVEWALVTLVVALAGWVALIAVRGELGKMFDNVLKSFLG